MPALSSYDASVPELLMRPQLRRGSGTYRHALAGGRMRELKTFGMQEVPAVAGEPRMPLQPAASFINRIANQWMAGIRHVDADLMRPAGRDVDTEQRLIVASLQHDRDAVARAPAIARRLD